MVGHFYTCTMLTIAIAFFCTTNVAAREVCYDDEGLGCFNTELKCNAIYLPQSPKKINTEFYLFTHENPSREEVIDWTKNSSIINSKFQGSRKTKFIIHGFTHNIFREEFVKMKDALLSIGKFNVILVNWADGAGAGTVNINRLVDIAPQPLFSLVKLPKEYLEARQNTRLVGRQIGKLSEKLQLLKKAKFSDMHLIGHSLGAQVAGYAGEYISHEHKIKYGRITGLDPAGRGYAPFSSIPGCHLDTSDATFVDIIHTDVVLGTHKVVGHQDFFPNGGKIQVGCPPLDFICHHLRAVAFFTESITSKCEWRAYPCSLWVQFKLGFCRRCEGKECPRMGYFADLSRGTGKFMLGTNGKKPYCKENSGQPPRLPISLPRIPLPRLPLPRLPLPRLPLPRLPLPRLPLPRLRLPFV